MKKRKVIRGHKRQGDVLVMAAGTPGAKHVEVTPAHRRVKDKRGAVLAEGEATGHHHRIEHGATLLRAEGVHDAMLVVDVSGLLLHEEHDTLEIGGGTHVVRIQREYAWAEKTSRPVVD